MRFGEHDCAGYPGCLAVLIEKGMKEPADDGQLMARTGINAPRFQLARKRCDEPLAVMEIGNQVQALHGLILFASRFAAVPQRLLKQLAQAIAGGDESLLCDA